MATIGKASSKKTKSVRTRATASSRGGELLLEIGTEELPYQFVAPALQHLGEQTERLLTDVRLSFGTIKTIGTPRRLVLLVERLAAHQASAIKETMGPSKAVAFDQAGHPTKAAIGFAGGQGVPVEQLAIRTTPKGEYVFAVKEEQGQPAASVLSQQLPKLIGSLSFPKSMHWNETGVRFARPIRWLVALCHGTVLPVEFAGIRAGSVSYGHRFTARTRTAAAKGFPVRTIAQYLKDAERHGVIVEQERRRAMILDQLSTLAKSAGGVLHHDEELIEQAVYAVEYPHSILGSFQPHYLVLPKEVLMTSMKEHQGYFALVDRNGALLPHFLAVTNTKLPDMGLIREGNERVLSARLADAKFFYDEDRKTTLEDKAARLMDVLFLQNCGTLRDKSMRMAALAASLAEQMGRADLRDVCSRAAWLSKVDLITGIVGEFPSLQGIMGGEYAKHDGEPREVWEAIRDHYLPKGMEGDIPATLSGRIVSLADRLDTIGILFFIGRSPSGSEDPFALRRHALAMVRIILEADIKLNLAACIEQVWGKFTQDLPSAVPQSRPSEVMDFVFERLRYYGRTNRHLRDDVMEAVLSRADRTRVDLRDLAARMEALQGMTSRAEFDPLIIGFKRAHRLSEKEQWDRKPVDAALFDHQAEVDLYQMLQRAYQKVKASLEQGDYGGALDVLVGMKEPIDAFFSGVLVNAEDSAVRGNRLSLLKDVDELFMSFADFSQIMVQGA